MKDFFSKMIWKFFTIFKPKEIVKVTNNPEVVSVQITEEKPAPAVIFPSDLEKYCAQIRATIYALEEEWRKGQECLKKALANQTVSQLLGDEIVASYERLITREHQGQAFYFRRHNIELLLERTERILCSTTHVFKSTPQKKRNTDNQIVLEGLFTGEPEEQIFLRLDQLLSYHFWGIRYELNDSEASDIIVNHLLKQSLKNIAQGLRGLQDIEAIANFDLKDVQAMPDLVGQEFEQLMLDILNEDQKTTHQARFLEDFFEKTDLRYKAKDLKRKKGARIQVTSTITPEYHAEKVAQIKRSEEMVILSPRSLAVALHNNDLNHHLDLASVLSCLNASTIRTQAIALRLIFLDAIKDKSKSPQGPLHFVPQPIRSLVRTYVHLEAHRTTQALRERESLTGTSKTIYSKRRRWERRKRRKKLA